MSVLLDPTTILRLNEKRQQTVIADIGDEHEHIPVNEGGGTSQAIGCSLDAPLSDEGIDRVKRFLRERGGRPSIDLTDQSGKESFAVVARAGMSLAHTERVYAVELSRFAEPAPVPGLEIEQLDPNDADQVGALVRHRVEGFAEPGEAPSVGEFEAPVRLASLWGAVVGEPFRRRGIQAALIARRLRQGIEEGCSVAVIECEPGIPTERNAMRLGFSLAYTRLEFKAPVSA